MSENHRTFSVGVSYGPFKFNLKVLKLYFSHRIVHRNTIGSGGFSKIFETEIEGKNYASKFIEFEANMDIFSFSENLKLIGKEYLMAKIAEGLEIGA